MFYDKAKIYVKGGDGGNGCIAMRREKYVPEGGPWGGDGGRGGSVIFRADKGLNTLVDFRYRKHFKADRGQHGMGKNMNGRSADDLLIRVPAGTIVRDADNDRVICDLVEDGQETVVARGGRGGRGNAHFASAERKAPRVAEKGEPGEEHNLALELKLIADVGLIGFPNAGKSTIISRVSAAKPKIADYPFTTLVPNLGVVRVGEDQSFVLADIPGLIEGAHQGVGLGHEFLRHTERTRVLVHVLDTSGGTEGRDPLDDFRIINQELALYDPKLARHPQVIAANKIDLPEAQENLTRIQAELGATYEIFPVSAVTGQGLEALMYRVYELLAAIPKEAPFVAEPEVMTVFDEQTNDFEVKRQNDYFVVSGKQIEKLVTMTYLEEDDAVERLQRIMNRMGVDQALRQAGIKPGDAVQIRDWVFEWVE